MTNAPERIWIEDEFGEGDDDQWTYGTWDVRNYRGYVVEYVRADTVQELTAERDRLRYERDAILLDGTVHSDQREKYERLCARIAAGKASQQDAVEAIRQLCRDNERLALRRSDARAEAAEAERDSYRKALEDIIKDYEPGYPLSHDVIKYVARAALKGGSHE